MKSREIAARIRMVAPQFPNEPAPLIEPKRHEYAYGAHAAFKAAVELYEQERKERAAEPVEVFRLGAFAVRCLPYREAIERVAAKFEKGLRREYSAGPIANSNRRGFKPCLRRPPDADAMLRALEAELGDTESEAA